MLFEARPIDKITRYRVAVYHGFFAFSRFFGLPPLQPWLFVSHFICISAPFYT